MIHLVYGGSGSGKSQYAESVAVKLGEEKKYYIATMQVNDEEGKSRVERHKGLRKGKGFETIECRFLDEGHVQKKITEQKSTVLLECLSNLVANEMFQKEKIIPEDSVVKKICRNLEALFSSVKNVVVVSNNIFEDGTEYDETTKKYMRALGKINQYAAGRSDKVTEVVCGIPLEIK